MYYLDVLFQMYTIVLLCVVSFIFILVPVF